MTGTILNVVTVLIGGSLGLLIGARFPDRIRKTIIAGLGLFTFAIGINMFSETGNAIVVLLSLLFGALIGESLKIETGLENLGQFLQQRFGGGGQGESEKSKFVKGFLTASLVFCVGPMTILGCIQDGLNGDYQLLAIKSVLDGFASMAFASSLGVGVLFSVLVVFGFQGSISLLAGQFQTLINNDMINEMTAVGGVLLIGLAISSLLEIKKIRVGNFLPALLIAPLIVYLLELFNLSSIF